MVIGPTKPIIGMGYYLSQILTPNKKTRKFFDWLRLQLGYDTMEDWYQVSEVDIHKHGGTRLLQLHNGSLSKSLQTVYPEHNWVPWRFHKTPNGFWENKDNQHMFF